MTTCSVVMSVFNGEDFLQEAIESVLNQSLKDFEFIIINDCSTDKSLEIVQFYQDKRIILIQNDINIGLAASLNLGVSIAKNPYIARMDADDIMLNNRLEKQTEFLDSNKKIGVCGSFAIEIDKNSNEKGLIKTATGAHLNFAKWIPSPVIHSSVMIRTELLKNNLYDISLDSAQDYDLWLRLLMQGVGFYNIKSPLLKYRIHTKSITQSKLSSQSKNAYSSFIKQTKLPEISYRSFLSFCLQNYETGVFSRFFDAIKVQKRLKLSFLGLIINLFRYFIFKYILKKENLVNGI
ncbi:MAG: exopolysaccharide biosynthesis protein [Candidatus Cloacimonadota bacterium]|nr:MAG: exopolysaccharide biosynthesis protein [Candidatus Cloacimonadota bacterium]